MENKINIENLMKLNYSAREAFNSLRTNLSFCGIENQVIMFTSCTPNEGKSTVVMELSRSLAEDNKKVVLLDVDIRKSILVGRYRLSSKKTILGLSHYLSGQKKLDEVLYETNIENLHMIIAGPAAPNPTELLGNERFKEMIETLKQKYDIILLDCPPLGWVIDAAVVAPCCNGAVLVVESNAISYKYLQDVKKQLEMTGIPILGAVLNKVKIESGGKYGGKYGKYGKYRKYEKYSRYGQYARYEQYGELPKEEVLK